MSAWGVCPGGSTCPGTLPPVNWSGTPPVNWSGTPLPCEQTDACKLITLPQTLFVGGKKEASRLYAERLPSHADDMHTSG